MTMRRAIRQILRVIPILFTCACSSQQSSIAMRNSSLFSEPAVSPLDGSSGTPSQAEELYQQLLAEGAVLNGQASESAVELVRRYVGSTGLFSVGRCAKQAIPINAVLGHADRVRVLLFSLPRGQECAGSMSRTCTLAQNCTALESTIFCDSRFFTTRRFVSFEALSSAYEALLACERGQRTGCFINSDFNAGQIEGLAELASAQETGLSPKWSDANLPMGLALWEFLPAELQEPLFDVAISSILTHELAHIEENLCGRDGRDGSLLSTAAARQFYAGTTCRGELDVVELRADVRAIEVRTAYLKAAVQKLSQMAASLKFASAAERAGVPAPIDYPPPLGSLDPQMRPRIIKIIDAAVPVLLVATLFAAEYDAMIAPNPHRAKALAGYLRGLRAKYEQGIPIEPKSVVAQYIRFGSTSAQPEVGRHIDPGNRIALSLIALRESGVFASTNPYLKHGTPELFSGFVIGAIMSMREKTCGMQTNQDSENLMQILMPVLDLEWARAPLR